MIGGAAVLDQCADQWCTCSARVDLGNGASACRCNLGNVARGMPLPRQAGRTTAENSQIPTHFLPCPAHVQLPCANRPPPVVAVLFSSLETNSWTGWGELHQPPPPRRAATWREGSRRGSRARSQNNRRHAFQSPGLAVCP